MAKVGRTVTASRHSNEEEEFVDDFLSTIRWTRAFLRRHPAAGDAGAARDQQRPGGLFAAYGARPDRHGVWTRGQGGSRQGAVRLGERNGRREARARERPL